MARYTRSNPRFFGFQPKNLLAEGGGALGAVLLSDHFIFPTALKIAQRMAASIFGNTSGLAVRELSAASTLASGVLVGAGADMVLPGELANEVKRGGVGIGALRAVVGAFQGGAVNVSFPPANQLPGFGGTPALPASTAPTTAGGTPTQAAPPAPVMATTSGDLGI